MDTPNVKKEIRRCDIYVVIILFLVFGIHFMTNFFISLKSAETKTDIDNVVMVYEQNVFMGIKMWSDKLLNLIFTFIKPGIVIFSYWYFRNRTMNGKMEVLSLQCFIMLMFFVLVTNFLNDFSILAGLLAKGVL